MLTGFGGANFVSMEARKYADGWFVKLIKIVKQVIVHYFGSIYHQNKKQPGARFTCK
jgi:hypothetical protein